MTKWIKPFWKMYWYGWNLYGIWIAKRVFIGISIDVRERGKEAFVSGGAGA